MSILMGERFGDICETIWGKDWKVRASKRLDLSERQLRNIETGHSNVTLKLRLRLLDIVKEQRILLDNIEAEISG